jgi:peptide deformylase
LGLSANQIGINKQVAVVNVDGNMLTFMNPKVTSASQERLLYTEGCLSVPGKIVTTIRHKRITVECLNWANPRTFQSSDNEMTLKSRSWSSSIPDKKAIDRGLLECIVVQHQLCLLDGVLITDKLVKFNKQVVNTTDHGRNDKVMIEKDGKSQFLKYKKAEPLLKDGWKIV